MTRSKTRQRTFYVDNQKITVKSYRRTHLNHPLGFKVTINGTVYEFFNELDRQTAENRAYTMWVMDQQGSAS